MIKKKHILNIFVIGLILVGLGLVISRFVHFGRVEYTDNATVCQHITPLNTRVPGFVKEIRYEEFQTVAQGDTLVILDDSEFRLQLAQAEADYANAKATARATSAGIATTENNIHVSDASIEAAQVELNNAEKEDKRYSTLLANKAVTQQQYDAVHTRYLAAKARFDQVSRAQNSTRLAKNEQGEHLGQAEALIRLAEARIEMAKLNISYCTIVATADGVVGKQLLHVGQLVQPGQMLVQIVDSNEKWVVANYRESQLKHIAVGNKVEITVDAIGDEVFEGEVESLSAATGAAATGLPADNATGNFVKVEQRVPVRIRLVSGNIDQLKAGYNVECEVKY